MQSSNHVGPDAAEHFLSSLQNDLNKKIMHLIERDVDMIWKDTVEQRFNEATDCYICNKPLYRDQNIIVRDHNYFHGEFRSAVHQTCNVQYKIDKEHYKLPVFFHNLRGYDSHLIMQAIRKHHRRIDVIQNNYEQYQSITIGQLKVLDSFQFLPDSLDN